MSAAIHSRIFRLTAVACVVAAASVVTQGVASGHQNTSQAQLRGRTSQGWGATLLVAPGGYVSGFAASVTLSCNGERADRPMIVRGYFPIRYGGFSADVSVGDGRHYRVQGRFASTRRASGTLTYGSTRLVFGGVEVCVTRGIVRWTVSR
jgi:hypothetical protein